jgi:IS4 transposase
LKERYPRVARYYHLACYEQRPELYCTEDLQRKQKAESLDGSYLLKSSRNDLSAEDIWRTYVLLSRVEAAFRAMKSPLCERPIFHHLERRVETHIFLCVLAYHLLVCIERAFLEQGIHTSWETFTHPTIHSPGRDRATADHRWPSAHHRARYTARANPP